MSQINRCLWLVRHGNRMDFIDENWTKLAPDPTDPPLAPDGFTQALETARRLANEPIKHVFSSPFLRALQTASPIADALDLPVKPEKGLSEMLLIKWYPDHPKGLYLERSALEFPRIDRSYQSRCNPRWPETEHESAERCKATIHALIQDFYGDMLLVGHGGSIANICGALVSNGNPDLHLALCCLVKLVCRHDKWEVELSGHDTSHLSRDECEIRLS